MTDKEKYRNLCKSESSISLFAADWWLDCVCGEASWNVELFFRGKEIEAALPFYQPLSNVILMPPYTQTLGIWFNPKFEDKTYARGLSRKHAICTDLITRLPEHTFFSQNFHYSFTDWLPFYWRGFRQTTRYTYVLDVSDKQNLESNLGEDVRKNIRKAKEKFRLHTKRGISISEFMTLNKIVFERQGKKQVHPRILQQVIETAINRKQGEIWGVFDSENQLHAAAFVAWQGNCAYLIASGSDTKLRKSGGHALAVWEILNDLPSEVSLFDFEGSMIKGVEHFNREFGAKQMPYFVIEKGRLDIFNRIRIKLTR